MANRYRDLIYNPLVQLGVGGLLGGLSGQAPAQAFTQTGGQVMQLGRQLEQQEALKILSQMPELTTMQKRLLQVAPGEVVKSLLTPPATPEPQARILSDEEVIKIAGEFVPFNRDDIGGRYDIDITVGLDGVQENKANQVTRLMQQIG